MNRRSVLKTTVASLAATVPAMLSGGLTAPVAAAISEAAPYIPNGSDAELIRLGVAFDHALSEWLPAWREWRRVEILWRQEIEARGMSFHKDGSEKVYALYAEMGGDTAADANEAALDKLCAVAKAIDSMRAATLAGLAVKAKVASHNGVNPYDLYERPAYKLDREPGALLAFFAEVEAMARGQA